ncbi:hypothetical protein D3C77_519300 [compost metagenome]
MVSRPWASPPLLRSTSPLLLTVSGWPAVKGLMVPERETSELLGSMFRRVGAVTALASPRVRLLSSLNTLALIRLTLSQLI